MRKSEVNKQTFRQSGQSMLLDRVCGYFHMNRRKMPILEDNMHMYVQGICCCMRLSSVNTKIHQGQRLWTGYALS